MRNFLGLFLSVGVALCFFVSTAWAATMKIESDFSVLHVDDMFTITVVVDTLQQSLNAVESTISFPADLLEFVSADDSTSVIPLWIVAPEHHDNLIHFAGIAPGGFIQNNASLLTITFKVKQVGQADIHIVTAQLLRNDGEGTPVSVVTEDLHISSVSGGIGKSINSIDDEMPEQFTPVIMHDPDVYEGNTVLIFSTKDVGSGIDHYEVREGFWGRYTVASSPYEISDTTDSYALFVKAIDHRGNSRTAVVYPQEWRPFHTRIEILGTIFILCLLLLLTSFKVFASLRQK